MDWLIRILWRQSYAIGLVPSMLCAAAWLIGGAVAARSGVGATSQYPRFAWGFLIVTSVVVALGSLVCFWILASHLEFRKRGYQIRWLTADEWVYEERRANGSIECMPFSRQTVGDGYPAPCQVFIHSEKSWEQQAPQWAHGRRAEILERIGDLSGADRGGQVDFIDTVGSPVGMNLSEPEPWRE
jgi:hypothetical protein